jgi:hypothetical protein
MKIFNNGLRLLAILMLLKSNLSYSNDYVNLFTDGYLIKFKTKLGWYGSKRYAKKYNSNVIFYPEKISNKKAIILKLNIFPKKDENVKKDFDLIIKNYKKKYNQKKIRNIKIINKKYNIYSKKIFEEGKVYEYISYVNPGIKVPYLLGFHLIKNKKKTNQKELNHFKYIINNFEIIVVEDLKKSYYKGNESLIKKRILEAPSILKSKTKNGIPLIFILLNGKNKNIINQCLSIKDKRIFLVKNIKTQNNILHNLIKNKKYSIINKIISKKNIQLLKKYNKKGMTPLHMIIESKKIDLLKRFIKIAKEAEKKNIINKNFTKKLFNNKIRKGRYKGYNALDFSKKVKSKKIENFLKKIYNP